MTTIAWDGKIIAADGQRTYRSERAGMSHKKLFVRPNAVYAYTGLTPEG